MPKDFEDFYEDTVMDGDNEELTDLVRLHMGTIHLNTLNNWLKAAFRAGQKSKK